MAKRMIDVMISAIALTLLSPLLLVVAVLIRQKLGGPILFAQARPGFKGQLFRMFKFRTMTDERDCTGNLLPDKDRLFAFGRWLRSCSIDELPGLWNVLSGDMSLVGPRPLLTDYLPLYTLEQSRRHDVRPGITGWAQVNGRNAIGWDEKFVMDVWYVDNQSILIDFQILFMTVKKVIIREGISDSTHATMPRFTGSSSDLTRSDQQ
jgi:lipopolysaccharide/colanic/teichoic acid biosynthesis glycosyltransferase